MNSASAVSDSTAGPPEQPKARADGRSNLFVTATLHSPFGSAPVRIRNLSRGGALVEGAVLPDRDSEIRLDRGSLTVSGHVAWCEAGKAGLRFATPIAVADWLPQGNRAARQQSVDEIVFNAKSTGLAAVNRTPPGPTSATSATTELAHELVQLKNCLDAVAEVLAHDSEIAARYQSQLRILDLTAQRLGKLATAVIAPTAERR
jgi:hypothetical protein